MIENLNLLERNKPIKYNRAAIYFLFNSNKELIYIGKTKKLRDRMKSPRVKDFNFYSVLKTKKAKLNKLENEYILHYKPSLNLRKYHQCKKLISIPVSDDMWKKHSELDSFEKRDFSEKMRQYITRLINEAR